VLPSFYVQIFNTAINTIEAVLLVYIAVQAYLNNQAIREKQTSTNQRLDTIFDSLKSYPRKGINTNGKS